MDTLTVDEVAELGICEAVVGKGFRTFIEVGAALATIRDRRLYRATHDTFAGYLGARWEMSTSTGYRLIDAAKVAKVVSPVGEIANEAQARQLVGLTAKNARLVYAAAIAATDGKPTAHAIVAARDSHVLPTPRPPRDDTARDRAEARERERAEERAADVATDPNAFIGHLCGWYIRPPDALSEWLTTLDWSRLDHSRIDHYLTGLANLEDVIPLVRKTRTRLAQIKLAGTGSDEATA